jgi:lysophospholipase L1-like esterase
MTPKQTFEKFGDMFQKPRLSNAVSHRVFPTTERHTHPVTCRTTGVYLKHTNMSIVIPKFMKISTFLLLFIGGLCILAGCESSQESSPRHSDDSTVTPRSDSSIVITAIGDSITWGAMAFGERVPSGGYPAILEAKLRADGYDVIVRNEGIPGEKAYETRRRFISAINDADIVLLMIGTNDIIRSEDCPEPHHCRTAEHIAAMLDKASHSNVIPFVSTVTPAKSRCARDWANPPIRELNEKIYTIAQERNIKIVDNHQAILDHGGAFFSDCLHFKDEGYGVIAQQWYNALVETNVIKKAQK